MSDGVGGVRGGVEQRVGGKGGIGVGGDVDVTGGAENMDQSVRVFACQSITGFSHSRYGMPRISDYAASGLTKKELE